MEANKSNEVTEKLSTWNDQLVGLLPNLVLAVIIIVAFSLIARLVRSWIRSLGYRVSDNKAVSNLFALLAYIGTLITGLAIALQIMNLDGAATSILAGAGIAGVAIGFAFQDIAANFIAGVVLAVQRPMKIGDLVETHDIFGIVRHINLRSTEIETLQGQLVHIPNKDILLNPMTDYSHKSQRRVDIEIGVSYSDDLVRAKKVAIGAITSLKGINKSLPVDLYYSDFGDSSITFTLRFWAPFKKQTDYLEIRSQAIIAIKKAFDAEGIIIPFPVSTFELAPDQAKMLFRGRK